MARRKGSKIVECPKCQCNITVMPGEAKVCTACMAKLNKTTVRKLIKAKG